MVGGRAFGKMSPQMQACEGASRLRRCCEGPGVIPLGGLLEFVISQESVSFLEFD